MSAKQDDLQRISNIEIKKVYPESNDSYLLVLSVIHVIDLFF